MNLRSTKVTLFFFYFSLPFLLFSQQIYPDSILRNDPEIRQGKLNNGFSYFLKRNTFPENRISMHLIVKTGYEQEEFNQTEIAHLLEHMAFSGSEHFSYPSDYFESKGLKRGSDINAHTDKLQTSFDLEIYSEDDTLLSKALLFFKDCAQGMSLLPEKIDIEKKVVARELYLKRGYQSLMRNQYLKKLYENSRYLSFEKRIAGLFGLSPSSIWKFYKEWYRPTMQGLIVVGNIDVDKIETQIKNQFSSLRNPDTIRNYVIPFPRSNNLPDYVIVTNKEMQEVELKLLIEHSFQTRDSTYESYKFNIIDRLINQMLEERIESLRVTGESIISNGEVSIQNTFIDQGGTVSHLVVSASVKHLQLLRKGFQGVLKELLRVNHLGFSPDEITQAKKNLRVIMQSDSSSRSIAHNIIDYFVDKVPVLSFKRQEDLYNSILSNLTVQEINERLQFWIKDVQGDFVLLAPDSLKTILPGFDSVRLWVKQVQLSDIGTFKFQPKITSLMTEAQRCNLPKGEIVTRADNNTSGVTRLTLKNGISVYLKSSTEGIGKVYLHGFKSTNNSSNSKEDQIAPIATTVIAKSGLAEFNAQQTIDIYKQDGTSVSPYIYDNFEGFQGMTSGNVEVLLQAIFYLFTNPRKDPKVFEEYLKCFDDKKDTNPKSRFNSLINTHLRLERRSSKIDKNLLRLDELFKVFKKHFQFSNGFSFVISGNFNMEEIIPLIQKYLGNIPADTGNPISLPNLNEKLSIKSPKPVKKVIFDGPANNADVSVLFAHDLKYSLENEITFKLLARYLEDILTRKLRREEGGVYGVSVSSIFHPFPNQSYVVSISFQCDPQNYERMISLIRKEIDNLRTVGPDLAMLDSAKIVEIKSAESELKDGRFWSRYISQCIQLNNDSGIEDILDKTRLINKITGKDIKTASVKYFNERSSSTFALLP